MRLFVGRVNRRPPTDRTRVRSCRVRPFVDVFLLLKYILFAQLHRLDARVLVIVTAMPREERDGVDAFSLSRIAGSEHHARAMVRELLTEAGDKVRSHGGVVEEIREA